jgi:hypothetical protein
MERQDIHPHFVPVIIATVMRTNFPPISAA